MMTNKSMMKKILLLLLFTNLWQFSLAKDDFSAFNVSGIKLGMKQEDASRIIGKICRLKPLLDVYKRDDGLTKWRCILKPQNDFLKVPNTDDNLQSISVTFSQSGTVD